MPMIYKIDVIDALKAAGYNTNRIRKEKLLSQSTLQKLRSNDTTLSGASLETLCTLLHCQPGDILGYIE